MRTSTTHRMPHDQPCKVSPRKVNHATIHQMTQMTTTISFVRHGHVKNPHDIYYGRLPRFGLSEEGRVAACAAALALQDTRPAAVFSSPLLRARQTASIILEEHPGLRLRISQLLLEVHTPYDGRPRAELEQRGWDLYTGTSAPYEQPPMVLERALRFVAMVQRRFSGQYVIAITHGDLIVFLRMWAQGTPVQDANRPEHYPDPGSVMTLSFDAANPGRPTLF